MKTQKLIALVLSIAIAGLATGMAAAGSRWDDKKGFPPKRDGSFAVAGIYTGMLKGEVEIGGLEVVIPEGVAIYHVTNKGGRGASAASVARSYVHVSGLIRQEMYVAKSIIVSDAMTNADYSGITQPNVEADPKRAR